MSFITMQPHWILHESGLIFSKDFLIVFDTNRLNSGSWGRTRHFRSVGKIGNNINIHQTFSLVVHYCYVTKKKKKSENRIFEGKDGLENNTFVFQVRKHIAREIKCIIWNHTVISGRAWPNAWVSQLIDWYLTALNNWFSQSYFPCFE